MMPSSQSDKNEYFAAIPKDRPDEYVAACLEKIAMYRQHVKSRGMSDLWDRKLGNYYGLSENAYSSQRSISGGSEGELTNIKVNDLRMLVQDQLVTVTSSRPAGIAKAINSDVKSLKNARIGTALTEYYLSQCGFEKYFIEACEAALVVDEGFIDVLWDKNAGDPIRPDIDEQGQMIDGTIMSGDLKLRVHMPYNVARDYDLKNDAQKWHIISILSNKYDLAAANPKFKDDILGAEVDNVPQLNLQERKGPDNVYMHLVVHDRTPAVPNGRYSMIVGDSLIADMELPFPKYPIERMSPADVLDGSGGYCPSNDVMAMEQITDALHSILATNNITFGGQSLVGPPLTGIEVSEIAKGLRFFEIKDGQKIEALQLTKSAPETYTYVDKLSSKKQEAMGSVKGTITQQASQGASGSAMALVQAQAVQFNSGTQRSYFGMMSRVMTKCIETLRVYADTPRVAKIVGKSKAQGLKEFKYTGDDLNSISSVVFEQVNPVSQTVGGRLQMAQDLMNAQQITNPRQYLTLVETGSLDAMTNPDEERNLQILEENELLSEGTPISVIITENHADHIKAHMSVIASPQAKADPDLVANCLAHIQEHVSVWQDASMNNPAILIATGQQPLPPPPAPPMPPGMPPQGGPEAPAPQGPPNPMQGGPNAPLEASQPKGPNLPTNPATGEQAQVPGVNM